MIVFMGLAGSGKSVQGRMLADKFGLPWLSTGEFLRMLISGRKRSEMLSGKLLDDEEIITLVQKIFTLVGVEQEFVLDGFPRTTKQADWMLSQVRHGQLNITAVIYLHISQDVARERLVLRGRQDDKEEAIAQRLQEHGDVTVPIVSLLNNTGIKIFEINAEQTVEKVHEDIITALQPYLSH